MDRLHVRRNVLGDGFFALGKNLPQRPQSLVELVSCRERHFMEVSR